MNLAVNLAEKQLRDGTASSQVMTHFLKLATSREQLEQEKIRKENMLLEAKVASLGTLMETKQLLDDAIRAMGVYKGTSDDELYDDY